MCLRNRTENPTSSIITKGYVVIDHMYDDWKRSIYFSGVIRYKTRRWYWATNTVYGFHLFFDVKDAKKFLSYSGVALSSRQIWLCDVKNVTHVGYQGDGSPCFEARQRRLVRIVATLAKTQEDKS